MIVSILCRLEQMEITDVDASLHRLTVTRGANAVGHGPPSEVSLLLEAETDYSSSLGPVELSDEYKLVVDDSDREPHHLQHR